MYIHSALPFDCSMYFASNDTLFNLLRIYFEHKVHSPQCTFGCKLHSYFFVGNTLIGLRDLALWFTVPTSSKFKDPDIKTDVTVLTCFKNLNVNYVTPGIGLHRALVSIRLCQYGCYICVVFFWLKMLLNVLESLSPRAMHLERVRNPVDITAVRNPCFLRAGFDFEQVSLKVS